MTRKNAREGLVAIFAGQGFNAVLGYLPQQLGDAQTKVLAIYTKQDSYKMESKHLNHEFVTFNLDVLVKRENSVTHEDTLDTLHEVIRSVIRANISNAAWDDLNLDNDSDAFHSDISGVAYRVERHSLRVKITTV